MRATNVLRFILFGAVGFGIGGATGSLIVFHLHLPGNVAFLLGPLVWGAVGGASLGLAVKDFRRVVMLAVLGALGLTFGVIVGLSVGSSFGYSEVPIATIVGAVVGVLLSLAFLDWRTTVALGVAGAVGFGIGLWAGYFLRPSFVILEQTGETGSITVAGLVGGASLGAALGYLEKRKLAAEQRPRVR